MMSPPSEVNPDIEAGVPGSAGPGWLPFYADHGQEWRGLRGLCWMSVALGDDGDGPYWMVEVGRRGGWDRAFPQEERLSATAAIKLANELAAAVTP